MDATVSTRSWGAGTKVNIDDVVFVEAKVFDNPKHAENDRYSSTLPYKGATLLRGTVLKAYGKTARIVFDIDKAEVLVKNSVIVRYIDDTNQYLVFTGSETEGANDNSAPSITRTGLNDWQVIKDTLLDMTNQIENCEKHDKEGALTKEIDDTESQVITEILVEMTKKLTAEKCQNHMTGRHLEMKRL